MKIHYDDSEGFKELAAIPPPPEGAAARRLRKHLLNVLTPSVLLEILERLERLEREASK